MRKLARGLSPRGDLKSIEPWRKTTISWVVGLDEVGAGCLAGPLCVASFAFEVRYTEEILFSCRIADSKKLDPESRFVAARALREQPHCVSNLHWVNVEEIDQINIYWARMKAFWELILDFERNIETGQALYLVDGPRLARKHGVTPQLDELHFFDLESRILAESQADGKFFAVAAASILAKVARDERITTMAKDFSHYAWEKNKGYATPDHIAALRAWGPSPQHRASFCRGILQQEAGELSRRPYDEALDPDLG